MCKNGPVLQADVVCRRTQLATDRQSWGHQQQVAKASAGDSGTASPTSCPVSSQVRGWLLNCAMYAVRVWLLRFGPLQCHRSSQNNTCEQQHSTAQQPVSLSGVETTSRQLSAMQVQQRQQIQYNAHQCVGVSPG